MAENVLWHDSILCCSAYDPERRTHIIIMEHNLTCFATLFGTGVHFTINFCNDSVRRWFIWKIHPIFHIKFGVSKVPLYPVPIPLSFSQILLTCLSLTLPLSSSFLMSPEQLFSFTSMYGISVTKRKPTYNPKCLCNHADFVKDNYVYPFVFSFYFTP